MSSIKFTAFNVSCLGLAILFGLLAMSEYMQKNNLIDEIEQLQTDTVESIDSQTLTLMDKLKGVISDHKIVESERLTIACSVQDFKNILNQYGRIALLNNKSEQDKFYSLRVSQNLVLRAFDISPETATVDEISSMVDGMEQFRGGIQDVKTAY
ncbi:hypothetical protein [Paenibacillus pinistramenti]|uniref:hypothetical protein n=1 Tax=Paenibacillus pinistramenti TaxID=1768003 RepID=UPI001107F972|nr:hypothetical protein [Paenibacillus pinistramenti]